MNKNIKYKLTLKIILVFFTSLIFIMLTNGLTQTPGSYGKMQRTMESMLFERLVGQNFASTYSFWSLEVQDVVSLEDAVQIAKRSDNLRYEAGPVLEAALGKEKANKEYLQMADQCFKVRTKETMYRIRDDFTDYLFSPFSLLSRGGNGHISSAGYNYALFREHCPRLSKWYFWGSLGAMIFGCILSILIVLEKLFKREKPKFFGWLLLYMLLEASWVTISSSNPINYGNVLFIIFIWYLIGIYYYITMNKNIS